VGLFAGFLATVLVFEASLRGFGAAVYTQVRLIEVQHLDSLATALLLPAIQWPPYCCYWRLWQSVRRSACRSTPTNRADAVQPSAAIGNNKSKGTTP
jgi:hypothetical protein